MIGRHSCAALIAALSLFAAVVPAGAQAPEAGSDAGKDAGDTVWQAASAAMQRGPTTIELRDQAKLALPAGYGFVPVKEARAVMELMGNQTDERFLGLIFPTSDNAQWFVTMDYEKSGYIKDDDARDWDADKLLQSLKDGTETANEHRKEIGVPAIEVTRWVESPRYDASSHQLVWSAEARQKDGQDPDPTINYNTYVLGRQGYISMDLITTAAHVESEKPAAHALLAAVAFNEGKRYTDFNASTDKVAAYGLAALVGGLAAKKLGLLAMAGVFLAKFAKLILVGLAAVGGGVAKLFKRKESANP